MQLAARMPPAMPPGISRARAAAAALAVLALLTAGLTAATSTTATASATPGAQPPPTSSERADAQQALADVQALLDRRPAASTRPTRDATMALLRLAQTRSALTGAQRAAADQALTRPALDHSYCTPANCYHWSTTGPDAVDPTDADANGRPDYVDSVISTVDGVRASYVAAGYRTPEPDGTLGGNSETDIYLADVGSQGYYGYCTSDKTWPQGTTTYDGWAYCVLDNDFSASQFPAHTPLENLEVTAAHEYFHAVQFAYDAWEDSWFMEATATWAEDELFNDVNDNVQYLANSPLTRPDRPLDTWANSGIDNGAQYGEWIFFRFLTEGIPAAVGGMPTLVRDMWRRADASGAGPDDYSIQAVRNVLAARGVSFDKAFALFAATDRLPRLNYSEGAANHYPGVGPAASLKLTGSHRDSGWRSTTLSHLASATDRFTPSTGLSATAWKLRISLDLPSASTHPAAVVTVVKRTGAPQYAVVPLNGQGNATKTVPFGSKGVKYVEVTLANAGTDYNCWSGGAYSCTGSSRDDWRTVRVRATAVR